MALHKIHKKVLSFGVIAALTFQIAYGVLSGTVFGASLTNTYVRLDRMKAATATTVRLVFTVPAGNSGTEENLKITVPDGFTVATSSQTATTAACATQTGATALPGTLVATGNNTVGQKGLAVSGVTNLTASTAYCVDFTLATAMTNPAAGLYNATVETFTSGAALIDSTSVALRVITDDQVVVSAVVGSTFNFVLDANTTSFTANLDSGAVRSTTGRTVTITTNATNGWIAWVKDSNQGLISAAAAKTIATSGTVDGSPTTLSTGTEGYVLDVDLTTDAASGGTVSIAGEYNGGANAGGTLSSTFQPGATSTGTAGGSGDVITFVGKAAIAGDTPAANDYTDTWTIIGAGTF
ncbi:MAG TPA: hypothetical protein VK674_04600 [Candidatus Limnocylindria bacterium]|nr:hypothetical protein [Candidatus Limnocylindria bacterium]